MSAALAFSLTLAPAAAGATTTTPSDPDDVRANSSIPFAQRSSMLGPAWASSHDRAVTSNGDASGFHVLVADAKDGYTWRTAATLTEPGTETDQWIGRTCVTSSGRRAVVVYAPRQVVNDEDRFHRGALAAVVDLETGGVTKLPEPVSLAYYNPGCGTDERAVLTQNLTYKGKYLSRLLVVDAAQAKITSTVDAIGQVTSAVPAGDRIVAAKGDNLVSVGASGALTPLAATPGGAFRLVTDGAGGVGYQTQTAAETEVHRYAGGGDRLLTKARRGSVQLHGSAGQVFLQGPDAVLPSAPARWRAARVAADAEVSTTGALAVESALPGDPAALGSAPQPAGRTPVKITATALTTGAPATFEVAPVALKPDDGTAESPAVPKTAGGSGDVQTSGTGNDTTDPNRKCAIPRNDPRVQALQETPQMAEWAADLAVKGALTVGRPAGYNGSTLPAYSPQGMFPMHALRGGGQVPAQVLLGVMAQESNMWQASPHAVDGESGNFEQGGFYGRNVGVDKVDFAHADCGYGATQVTTGMTVGEGTSVYSHDQQVALTVDYAANIAAGLNILIDKWNQMKDLGVVANNADPRYVENWWFALWAYNSGWHKVNDPTDPNSHSDVYGLGWSNNVANQDLIPDRKGFMDNTTSCKPAQQDPNGSCNDAKHPGDWTYPERIMGWAKHSLVRYDWQAGEYDYTFQTAMFGGGNPSIPQLLQFCAPAQNMCDPAKTHVPGNFPGTVASHCLRDDLACFWHAPSTWQSDSTKLGTEHLAYAVGSAEPQPYHFYNPDCAAGGRVNDFLIIDDVASNVRTKNGCGAGAASHGSLSFNFDADSVGNYPSKIDFHQLDSGYRGHYWFAHTWKDTLSNRKHRVSGTWTLDQQINGWARVLVYVPDHGADTPQAWYRVNGSDSTSPLRSVTEGNYLDDNRRPQAGGWRSLGAFHFAGTPSVTLDNFTHAGYIDSLPDGAADVAWDAIAFQPLPGKPTDQVVSLGDSYSSGEGVTPSDSWAYYRETDHDGLSATLRNSCHRSRDAWSRLGTLPDNGTTNVGTRADTFDPSLDYHMSACSGARSYNVATYGDSGQFGEPAQIDQGYLDNNTNLVTVSVGGNDARFVDILNACALYDRTNPADLSCGNMVMPGDTKPISQVEPDRLVNTVIPAIDKAIRNIHNSAPNAAILLMGYPQPIESNTSCNLLFRTKSVLWFRDITTQLHDLTAAKVTNLRDNGFNIRFGDPMTAFAGKGACGTPEAVNEIVTRRSHGDASLKDAPFSQQSFHPNEYGSSLYAGVFTTTVQNW